MNKKFLVLLACLCLMGTGLWAAYPKNNPDMVRRVFQAMEEELENAQLKVARTSVVQIKLTWKNPNGEENTASCKGVLIGGGKYLVSHANCLSKPRKASASAKLTRVFFHFSNGYIYGSAEASPEGAGSFIYWKIPEELGLLKDITPAVLSVSDGIDVIGQLGYNKSGKRKDTFEQEFVFRGESGWHFGSFQHQFDTFTLRFALQERQFGEPVFIGNRVIALNSAGGQEGTGDWSYPFHRPKFTVFTRDNGGNILANL